MRLGARVPRSRDEGREFGRPVCPVPPLAGQGFKLATLKAWAPGVEVYTCTRGCRERRSRGEMGGRIRAKRMTPIHRQRPSLNRYGLVDAQATAHGWLRAHCDLPQRSSSRGKRALPVDIRIVLPGRVAQGETD